MEPTQDIHHVRLEQDARLGVDEVVGRGGPPPADPVEGPLQGAGPRRREQLEHVLLGRDGLGAVVVGVVGHGLVDELAEVVVVLGGGGRVRGLAQLVGLLPELLRPRVVEALESTHHLMVVLFFERD